MDIKAIVAAAVAEASEEGEVAVIVAGMAIGGALTQGMSLL